MWDFIKEVYKNDTFLSIINSILGIGVILLGAVNYLYQKIFFRFMPFGRASKNRQKYEYVQKLVHEIKKVQGQQEFVQPYLIEMGYAAISGRNNLAFDEIIYCLNMKCPSQAFKYYTSGAMYIEYSNKLGRVVFKNKLNNENNRNIKRILFYLCYFVFGLASTFYVTLFDKAYAKQYYFTSFTFLIFSLCLFFVAILFLVFEWKLGSAENFMKLQDKMFKESELEVSVANKSETQESKPEDQES